MSFLFKNHTTEAIISHLLFLFISKIISQQHTLNYTELNPLSIAIHHSIVKKSNDLAKLSLKKPTGFRLSAALMLQEYSGANLSLYICTSIGQIYSQN